MKLLNEFNKVNQSWAKDSQPVIVEANITGLGKSAEYYTIKFRNSAKATNVYGPTGLKVGDSVAIAMYPGKTKKNVILGRSYRSSGTIKTVTV